MAVVETPDPPAAPEYTDGWAQVVAVVRWVLVALLVWDIAAGLATWPRPADLADLQRDLNAGRVHELVFLEQDELRLVLLTDPRVGGAGFGDPMVLWRNGPLDYRAARLRDGSGRGTWAEPAGDAELRGTIQTAAERRDVTAGVEPRDVLLRFPQLSTVVLLVLLAVLVLGGQPRRTTKWAALWVLLVPMNLGALWVLLRESPWSPQARALPEPLPHRAQPHDARLAGGRAFLLLLLWSVALGLLVAGYQELRY